MGKPLLVATALAQHVSGFLGGLFCKGLLERQLPGTEQEVKVGLRHAAARSVPQQSSSSVSPRQIVSLPSHLSSRKIEAENLVIRGRGALKSLWLSLLA